MAFRISLARSRWPYVLAPVLLAMTTLAHASSAKHLLYRETVRPRGADAEVLAEWRGTLGGEPLLLPVPLDRAQLGDVQVQGGRLSKPGPVVESYGEHRVLKLGVEPFSGGPLTVVVRWTLTELYRPSASKRRDDDAPSGRGDLQPLEYVLVNSVFLWLGEAKLSVQLPADEEVFAVLAPAKAPVASTPQGPLVACEGKADGPHSALALGGELKIALQRIPVRRGGGWPLWAVVIVLAAALLYQRRAMIRPQHKEPGHGAA